MTETTETTQESTPGTGKNLLSNKKLTSGLATAAVVGVGAALIEVEWIPGLLLGVAAMIAPEFVPKLGRGVRPLVHSAIKTGYAATRKTREWMAEAGEQVSDMVAEVRSASMEDDSSGTAGRAPGTESLAAASAQGSGSRASRRATVPAEG